MSSLNNQNTYESNPTNNKENTIKKNNDINSENTQHETKNDSLKKMIIASIMVAAIGYGLGFLGISLVNILSGSGGSSGAGFLLIFLIIPYLAGKVLLIITTIILLLMWLIYGTIKLVHMLFVK